MNFIRFVKISVSLIVVLLFLASCTKTTKDDGYPTPTKQDPLEQELISNPALSRSGALVVAATQIEGMFNPIFSETTVEKWIKDLVFDGLFVFNAGGELESALAKSWIASEDGLFYTVELKDGLTFHDGTKVLASDVVFSYETIKNPEYAGRYTLEASMVKSVVATDENTLTFEFHSDIRDNLKSFTIPILSENYYKFSLWDVFVDGYKNPMGTGPFKFETYAVKDSIVLIKNTEYWNQNAKISGIIIKQMDEATAIKAFSEGKIDLLELPASRKIVNDVKALGFGNVMTQNSNVATYVGMDLSNSLFSEPNIRKALIYGLDREKFILDEWSGYAETLDFLAVGINEYAVQESSLINYEYNVEKANQLLDAIGWVDNDGDGIRDRSGEKLAFTWQVFTDVEWSYNLAQIAAAQWKLLGFDVDIVYTDYALMALALKNGETPAIWNAAWEISRDDNPDILFGIKNDSENYNYGGYNNPNAAQIFVGLQNAETQYERESLLKQWHRIQNEDLPIIPIARLKSIWAYNSRVKNLVLDEGAVWTKGVVQFEIDVLQ